MSSTAFTTSPYHGLTKTIKFKSNGNISGTDIYVNQVQKGKLVQTRPHVVPASTSEKSRALRHAGCPAFSITGSSVRN